MKGESGIKSSDKSDIQISNLSRHFQENIFGPHFYGHD